MLPIGEFSRISRVTAKTLRYYDEIGLLKPIHVNGETGYRYYSVEQLKTVLFINRLKLYRFSLVEIASVLHGGSGLLPSLFEQKRRVITDEMRAHQFILSQLEHDEKNLERGIDIMSYLDTIPVKLVEVQPKNILFFRKKMNVRDYGEYLGSLYERIARETLTPVGPPISIFHDEEHDPESYDMEIAVPVQEAVNGTRELAGGLCAMATLTGPYTELPSIYAKLKEWMEVEGYTLVGAPYELYMTDPGKTAPEENITEIYFPVKK